MKIAWGVPAELIATYGAVSREVAGAMAKAVRERMGVEIGVSTTGVAGPDEIEEISVGTVFIGLDNGKTQRVIQGNFPPQRLNVKRRSSMQALFELRKLLLEQN